MFELLLDLPLLDGIKPYWNGNEFVLGDKHTQVLQYSSNLMGWDDELTFFHEDSAGHAHPMDVASRRIAVDAIKNNLKHINSPTILEIGCSSGYLIKDMKEQIPNAQIIGADVVSQPLLNLAQELPNIPLFQFDLTHCPLPNDCVDAIVMLNVLEHIENDQEALKQAYRILKPSGVLIIEVPAGPHLYDIYDEQLRHFRRYSSQELKSKANSVNFKILKSSHLGFFLYPAFAYVKKRNKQLKVSDIQNKKIVENNIKSTQGSVLLRLALKLENFLYNFVNYPVGIRCSMICLKK